MRALILITMLTLTLAACGVDGAPSAGTPGVTINGEVATGVVVVNPAHIEGQ